MPVTATPEWMLERKAEVVRALSSRTHELFKVLRWGGDSSADGRTDRREQVTDLDTADVISSKIAGHSTHTVMLDLDVPALLVPSSTPGHSHLYIDVEMSWGQYRLLLAHLASCGVIERGYYNVSVRKRATMLRLPWIKRERVASGASNS